MRNAWNGINLWIGVFAGFITAMVFLKVYINIFTDHDVIATVTKTEQNCANSCRYLVHTDAGIFENTDSLLRGKLNSHEFSRNIETKYRFHLIGFKSVLLNFQPNIIGYRKLK